MIKVILSEPTLRETIGKSELSIEAKTESISTVKDVLDYIEDLYNGLITNLLKNRRGDYKPSLILVLNGEAYQLQKALAERLSEGDTIRFLSILSGG